MVLGWRCYIKKYTHVVHSIEGDENVIADSLSRCLRLLTSIALTKAVPLVPPLDDLEFVDMLDEYFASDKLRHFDA